MPDSKYLTVTALNSYIQRKFDVDPYLKQVFITGEISNFRLRPNAHQYFALKDEKAKINAVMWKGAFAKLAFQPEEGMKVLVRGHISVYAPSGSYQLYIDQMEPDGVGALYQAYEQLKQRLAKSGVFDADKKQPLPILPRKVAVITSESGAVIKDIITTTRRRCPIVQLVLFPAVVQGDAAADDIVRQIKRANQDGSFDTLIVGRGGGSIEDLWPFNEERVAQAIYESRVPVISSVGHETDTTIADLVADQRAATPTAAAELAVPDLRTVLNNIQTAQVRITNAMQGRLNEAKQRLQRAQQSYVFQQPDRLYDTYVQQVDNLTSRLNNALSQRINQANNNYQRLASRLRLVAPFERIHGTQHQAALLQQRLFNAMRSKLVSDRAEFSKLVATLDHLSPLQTMGRGYSYVTKDDHVVSNTQDLAAGDTIELRFVDGSAKAEVKQVDTQKGR